MNTPELDPVALVQEAFSSIKQENMTLRESIEEVRAMMSYEDRGWLLIGQYAAGERLDGLELSEVQDIAQKIAPKVAGGSLPKRAVDLHSGFTFGRGFWIEGTEKSRTAGRPTGARSFFIDPVNQESVFSDAATEELQKARFIDGNVLAAVNTKTKKVNRIPFNQITSIRVDPDYPENILMYQRTWDTKDGTTDSIRKMWYVTRRFEGVRPKSIADGSGKRIPVDPDVTIVDLRANRQIGHTLGLPDGLAGLLWSETYGRVLSYGETVQEGLARIIFRVTSKTKQGTQSTAVKIASSTGHGNTASMADGQELTAVSTAGRGYDYASARPIAAMAAAAWNVSNSDLLNDASANGSSYGSAASLVPGNRNAMLLMQREWASFFKDIFETVKLGRPTVIFSPFEAPDKYRELQAITLGSVALQDEEYRMAVLDALDIVGDASDIPDTLKNRGVDANASANAGTQQAAPDQGVANGTSTSQSGGGGQGANDLRSDSISSSEALRREMALESLAERIERAVDRFEELSN